MSKALVDDFFVEVLAFMADLHDCHTCGYPQWQISSRNGKHRTVCLKYGLPIQRVRYHCIDKFQGYNNEELKEIKRQYKAGTCQLVINGVTV